MRKVLAVFLIALLTLAIPVYAQAATRQVSVSWVASTSTSVTGYNLYRCTVVSPATTCTPSSSSTPLNGSSTISGVSFTDNATTQASYVYGVIAVAPACTSTSSVTVPCGNSAMTLSAVVPVPPQTAGAGTIIITIP